MAKRVNSFAEDFQQMTRTAESVVQMVKQQKTDGETLDDAARSTMAIEPPKRDADAEFSAVRPQEQPSKQNRRQSGQPAKPKSTGQTPAWGKPVSLLNTRIPSEMAELLDDLVYRLKKNGTPRTKQELAHEALEDLLKKHAVI